MSKPERKDDPHYMSRWTRVMKRMQGAIRRPLREMERRHKMDLHYLLVMVDHNEMDRFGDVNPQCSSDLPEEAYKELLSALHEHMQEGKTVFSTATWDDGSIH